MADVDLKAKLTAFPVIKSVKVNESKAVELKWTKVPLAEKYDIKRSENPNGDFVHLGWAKGTKFADDTAQRNITYWYKVVAWKRLEGKKTSQKASYVRPVCLSGIPAAENLTACIKDGKVHLTWESEEGDRFYIYKKLQNVSRLFYVGQTDTKEFCDENTVSGQAYLYAVQTVKLKGTRELHGKFSKKVAGVFIDTTDIVSLRTTVSKRVYIDLKVVAGADGYILERSEQKDTGFEEVARSNGIVALSFEDKLPSRFKSYYYRACAYKIINETEYRGGYSAAKSTVGK